LLGSAIENILILRIQCSPYISIAFDEVSEIAKNDDLVLFFDILTKTISMNMYKKFSKMILKQEKL